MLNDNISSLAMATVNVENVYRAGSSTLLVMNAHLLDCSAMPLYEMPWQLHIKKIKTT